MILQDMNNAAIFPGNDASRLGGYPVADDDSIDRAIMVMLHVTKRHRNVANAAH